MAYSMGKAKPAPLRVDFDRRLKPEFHGSKITSDARLLAHRELGHALGLTGMRATPFRSIGRRWVANVALQSVSWGRARLSIAKETTK
jgi:hypothetical protein